MQPTRIKTTDSSFYSYKLDAYISLNLWFLKIIFYNLILHNFFLIDIDT